VVEKTGDNYQRETDEVSVRVRVKVSVRVRVSVCVCVCACVSKCVVKLAPKIVAAKVAGLKLEKAFRKQFGTVRCWFLWSTLFSM